MWLKLFHILRPLIIIGVASIAFTALLRLHHSRFEDVLIRSFQVQQMETGKGMVQSMEESLTGIRNDLILLANHLDVRRLSTQMPSILEPYFQSKHDILDRLTICDVRGQVLWQSAPQSVESAQNKPSVATPSVGGK